MRSGTVSSHDDMKFLNPLLTALLLACADTAIVPLRAADTAPLYESNFEKIAPGGVPDDFLILDGAFAVQQDATNKFLELPGAPLDTFGVLFGPTVKTNVAVSARIFGTSHGRRHPAFGVGLGGQSGYRLQVSPGKGTLDLYRADLVVAGVPYDWKSGHWTVLRLQVIGAGEAWKVQGTAWIQSAPEPVKPLISFDEKEEPRAGRASIWGSPFSTTPIRYDHLLVTRVESKP
jgi:hypothetical protein